MRKLLKFKNGDEYITGGVVSIEPNGVTPEEIYDLSVLTNSEIEQLKKNKKDQRLLRKAKKLNG